MLRAAIVFMIVSLSPGWVWAQIPENHHQLKHWLSQHCQASALVLSLTPPPDLVEPDEFGCPLADSARWHAQRQEINQQYEDAVAQQLAQMQQIVQANSYSHMSEWLPLDADAALTLQVLSQNAEYLVARMMAVAPAPLVGEGWGQFHPVMDNALRRSGSHLDRRLMVYAMFRDNRDYQAVNEFNALMADGDQHGLWLIDYAPLARRKADEQETVGYQMMATLENYLVRYGPNAAYCQWQQSQHDDQVNALISALKVNYPEPLCQ